jgi:hypothetical protein
MPPRLEEALLRRYESAGWDFVMPSRRRPGTGAGISTSVMSRWIASNPGPTICGGGGPQQDAWTMAPAPDRPTRHPWTLEDEAMPSVTFDTLLAERADGAVLITAARREGYDVVLVGLGQAALELGSLRPGDTQVISPSGLGMALALSIDLCRVRDGDPREPMTAAAYGPPVLAVELAMIPALRHVPKLPRKYRQHDEAMRLAASMWDILRILIQGADDLPSGSRACTPVYQRWCRVAVTLAVHAFLRRDIFVSDQPDVSSPGRRRQALSRLLKTRLMTTDEFRSWLARHRRRGKRPGRAGGSGG